MNKLLLFAGLVPFAGFGQIALTNTNFPAANEQWIMSTLLDLNIDFATTGANYNWDFTSLQPTGQRFADYKPVSQASTLSNLLFGTFAPAEYKASYFNASTDIPLEDLTASFPVTIGGISGFSKTSASALTMVGWEFVINGTGIPVRSDTIETRYEFPLEYGDAYDSRGYTHLNMNPIYDAQWTQHRYRQSTVDGWGVISTPYGTFNCLRIHHIVRESDSIYVPVAGGTWIGIPLPEYHEYEWRAAEEKEAILRINTSVLLGNETVSGVEYRAHFDPTLALNENAISLELFPNPANSQLTVRSNSEVVSLTVVNQQGQQVNSVVSLFGSLASVDLQTVDAGVYYVTVKTVSGTATRLIVKN